MTTRTKSLYKLFMKPKRNVGGSIMRLVVLESPYQGTSQWRLIKRWQRAMNIAYARRCLHDSLMRGESPIASHLLHTQVLNDLLPAERQMGMEAGLSWLKAAEAHVVYVDYGITGGMKKGIGAAMLAGIPTEYRRLGPTFENISRDSGGPSQFKAGGIPSKYRWTD